MASSDRHVSDLLYIYRADLAREGDKNLPPAPQLSEGATVEDRAHMVRTLGAWPPAP